MNSRSSLIDQLRIDRSAAPTPVNETGSRRGWWLLAAFAGVAAAVALAWWLLSGPAPVPVRVAIAREVAGAGVGAGSILDASGYVIARRRATVSAKVTGKVVEVLIEEGQRVERNQIIARLDAANAQAELERARADVEQANASLVMAQVALDDVAPQYRRSEQLVGRRIISQEDYEKSRAGYNAAKANREVVRQRLSVARATLTARQHDLEDMVVRAPFDGIVIAKNAQPGEIVSPLSSGGFTRTGIGTIVDMRSLEVEVDVSENFINRVAIGQAAAIRLNAYPDQVMPAKLLAVVPTADRAKATVKVRVGFEQEDPRILPDMGVRVSFLGSAAAPTPGPAKVVLPTAAVRQSGAGAEVFVIEEQTVRRRTVRLEPAGGDGETGVAGIVAGTPVAVGELERLTDGARIQVLD